jgi:hypothetical protein
VTSPTKRTPAGKGAYQPLRSAIVTQSSAYGIYPRRQRRFRDDPPVPHGIQKFVLADHPIIVPDEEDQQVERLGFEVNQLGAAVQFATIDVEAVLAKHQNHRRPPEPVTFRRNHKAAVRERKADGKASLRTPMAL